MSDEVVGEEQKYCYRPARPRPNCFCLPKEIKRRARYKDTNRDKPGANTHSRNHTCARNIQRSMRWRARLLERLTDPFGPGAGWHLMSSRLVNDMEKNKYECRYIKHISISV